MYSLNLISSFLFISIFVFGLFSSNTIFGAQSTDHTKFEVLQKNFKSIHDVTTACISCHTKSVENVMRGIHWTWSYVSKSRVHNKLIKGGDVVNNFCISTQSNELGCKSCHDEYKFKNKKFDFNDENNVDCLICHEQTGSYKTFPSGSGYPSIGQNDLKKNQKTYSLADLSLIAQSVKNPSRKNCGGCHFYEGGGEVSKHGDMDSSLIDPPKDLDVHMSREGANFTCTKCHTTEVHKIEGSYSDNSVKKHLVNRYKKEKISCESCHTAIPHKSNDKLNDHVDKVACQSCHIPFFARVKPTKMSWDWSKAGKKGPDGKNYEEKGPFGKNIYITQKGAFIWDQNVVPDYLWFDGKIEHLTVDDKIDPKNVVDFTEINATSKTVGAKIYPFKTLRGKRPYDKKNNNMVFVKLFGKKGSGAYWADFDWQKAIVAGMNYGKRSYSGEYGFVSTQYRYVQSHMVAPAEKALKCIDCHDQNDSRLKEVPGIYIPVRDGHKYLDLLGLLLLVLTFLGVSFHGLLRFFFRK